MCIPIFKFCNTYYNQVSKYIDWKNTARKSTGLKLEGTDEIKAIGI